MNSVTVISTGNELLRGIIADDNSGYICGRLYPFSIAIDSVMTVGDDTDGLEWAFRTALDRSDLVIITGGLGPTDDDNTIAALSRIFHFTTLIDEDSRSRMETFFRGMGAPVSRDDLKMVEVPRGSRVINNSRGLAPGFILHTGNKIVIAMPGVPGEMREMMETSVVPFIKTELRLAERRSLTFRVTGMKESAINAVIRSMDISSDRFDCGITAGGGIAAITFVQKDHGPDERGVIKTAAQSAFGRRYLDPDSGSPEEAVVRLLMSLSKTVSFAESCTGGLISKRITDVPGSSSVFFGGVVAYDNSVKARMLAVKDKTLESYGAVSEEVAAEMATGARSVMNTDIAVSTTGIAGPGGGSETKPVGMVCFGLASESGITTRTRNFRGNRWRIRDFAALTAIELLRDHLAELVEGTMGGS